MQIALRKTRLDGKPLDTLIDWFSGFGGYCHAELVFGDGVSFSSTTYDTSYDLAGNFKKDGTRFKTIDYTEHPERWTLVEIDVTPDQEHAMRKYAATLLDARYDWWGCGRFVLPFVKPHADKYFCSEVCVDVLQHVGLFRDWGAPHKVSPNKLAKLLRAA